jgi:hypothetical protein
MGLSTDNHPPNYLRGRSFQRTRHMRAKLFYTLLSGLLYGQHRLQPAMPHPAQRLYNKLGCSRQLLLPLRQAA